MFAIPTRSGALIVLMVGHLYWIIPCLTETYVNVCEAPEAPHVFKREDGYYLMIAEGKAPKYIKASQQLIWFLRWNWSRSHGDVCSVSEDISDPILTASAQHGEVP